MKRFMLSPEVFLVYTVQCWDLMEIKDSMLVGGDELFDFHTQIGYL